MIRLLQKEWLLSRGTFLSLIWFMPIGLLTNLSLLYLGCLAIFTLALTQFYNEEKSSAQVLFVSMPFPRRNHVVARFLLLLLSMPFVLIWMIFMTYVVEWLLPNYLTFTGWSTPMMVSYFLLAVLLIAVIMPIYYFFQNVLRSLLFFGAIIFILLIIFVSAPVEFIEVIVYIADFIYQSPIVASLLYVLVLLVPSVFLSARLLGSKDLVA